ncbi:aromatic-ring-hydroxylating dioxygenase subunit beta [soil metagenome]
MNTDMKTWLELLELQHRYMAALDNDELERWPTFFTPDCIYEIIPKENIDAGLAMPVIYCRNDRMLRDRVTSLRQANIYEPHVYRHMASGLLIKSAEGDTVTATSSYAVIRTGLSGESSVYQAGRYEDECIRTDDGWRYRKKRVVYDTLRVQTLLATPI